LSTLAGQGLNPIRHLLALVGAHHIVHVSREKVKMCCKEGSVKGHYKMRRK
jgi:hypothetical protein